jgi:cob(I)alamin adenosyltransferase
MINERKAVDTMKEKGYIQVYTGDGKGKTTAAIGLAVRALGAGHRVLFQQYMKGLAYSEHNILPTLSPNLTLQTLGKPFFIAEEGMLTDEQKKAFEGVVIFPKGKPPAEYIALVKGGLDDAYRAATSGDYDLVVLDEINCALRFGLAEWADVERVLDERAPHTEIVLTGRGAPDALLARADLVTEMKEVKHYYSQGVEARRGIEN